MSKKEKYIDLSRDKIKELAAKEKVSEQTVYAALRFETNSSLAVKLRAMALQSERGGIIHKRDEIIRQERNLPEGKGAG